MQPTVTTHLNGSGQWKCFKGITLTLLILGGLHVLLGFISLGISVNFCKTLMQQSQGGVMQPMHGPHSMADNRRTGPLVIEDNNQAMVACQLVTLHGIGIFSGIMFVITGAIGFGASRASAAHCKSGLKTGFLVLTILNAIMFAPSLLFAICLQGMTFVFFENEHIMGSKVILFLEGVGAFTVLVLSIVGSAYACCCTPVEDEKAVPVIHMNNPTYPVVSAVSMPSSDKSKLILNEQLEGAANI